MSLELDCRNQFMAFQMSAALFRSRSINPLIIMSLRRRSEGLEAWKAQTMHGPVHQLTMRTIINVAEANIDSFCTSGTINYEHYKCVRGQY